MYESGTLAIVWPIASSPARNSAEAAASRSIERPALTFQRGASSDGLRVHPVIDEPHHRLHVAGRLDRTAHHAERRERRAVARRRKPGMIV